MEVLFVSHKYPPAVGGMEKQSLELVSGMKKHATVHTIVYTGGESRLRFFLSLEKKITETCRKHPGISVIHFNDGLIAAVCLRHKGYAHLLRAVTVHGLDVVFPSTIYQKYILPAFNRFDLIVAVSRATANACIERGINAQKVIVINNGVDTALAETSPSNDFHHFFNKKYGIDLRGKIVLTTLGRPVQRKGFSWFIKEVVPGLKGDFVFLMIGPFHKKRSLSDRLFHCLPQKIRAKAALFLGYPTDENTIRNMLLQDGHDPKVMHLGKLPFDDIERILHAANAFVMPNIRVEGDMEGFGLVCLEAALCGTTVFASEIDGITDAIQHHKNGILLPSKNAAAWVSALNDLIQNPSTYAAQAQDAKTYTLENFGWDKMADAYWKHFKMLRK
ncbi:glycosyltransferase family 4 protein [Dyadobacter bucti]|uniref:glycosyltransferase family 4 protein n=1 Tax=Dyadobacter bucti TaxID=2572203 RepID=UPI003F718C69